MQTEYATDLVFRSDAVLHSLYGDISRQAVIAVKAEQVSSFLGKKITPQLAQEIGSRLSTRIEQQFSLWPLTGYIPLHDH